jgi:hypothetical protein
LSILRVRRNVGQSAARMSSSWMMTIFGFVLPGAGFDGFSRFRADAFPPAAPATGAPIIPASTPRRERRAAVVVIFRTSHD